MIDTVGFKLQFLPPEFECLRKRSQELRKYDHESNQSEFRVVSNDLEIGSFDKKITIRCFDDVRGRIEFSLPKQTYGNNIVLLYPEVVEEAVVGVYERLRDYFGLFPPYRSWFLDRLDLCYAWRFQDQATATGVLRVLQTLDYPRKKKHIYKGESVLWSGRAYGVKFYLKQNEYVKHDGKLDRKDNPDRYSDLLKLSEGVLRFEVSIRKQSLDAWHDNNFLPYTFLKNKQSLTNLLNFYLNRLLSIITPESTNTEDVIKKLELVYSSKKSAQLFQFYTTWYSERPLDRMILQEKYNPSTLYRKKKDLLLAGVGLPTFDLPINFRLDIPSENAVNTEPLPVPRGMGSLSRVSNTA